MNIGKFAIRFVCSWPIEPELSITNRTSIFVQPAPLPLSSGGNTGSPPASGPPPVSSPPGRPFTDGPHAIAALASTPKETIDVMRIGALLPSCARTVDRAFDDAQSLYWPNQSVHRYDGDEGE